MLPLVFCRATYLRGLFSGLGGFFRSAGSALLSVFTNLPIVSTLSRVFGTVKAFLSGQLSFAEAGKKILITLARGIWSAATYPYEMLKRALGWLRRLLPFSDAPEGPLSSLMESGAALLRTLAQGMLSVIGLPAQVLSYIFQRMLDGVRWIWDGLKSIGSQVISTLSSALSAGAQIASSAWSGITGIVSAGWNAVASIGSSAHSFVSAPFRWVAGAAGSLLRGQRSVPRILGRLSNPGCCRSRAARLATARAGKPARNHRTYARYLRRFWQSSMGSRNGQSM